MSSIVIALPKIEDAKKIRAVLARHGFTVASVCTRGYRIKCSVKCFRTWKRRTDLQSSASGYELS